MNHKYKMQMKARKDDRMELREDNMTIKAEFAKVSIIAQEATINEV